MFKYTISCKKTKETKIIFDELNLDNIGAVEQILEYNQISDFYYDSILFCEDYVVEKEEVYKKLFIFDTNISGYDIVTSVVICDYTQEKAKEYINDRYYCSSSFHKYIGLADSSVDIGEVFVQTRDG